MKIERLAAIAEIVSSVAIVATLAYLAIQSKQTNDMLLGSSRQAAVAADVTLLTSALDHPAAAARILGLDPETMQTQALLIIFMRAREFQWLQYRSGTLDRETFESYMSPASTWLQSDLGAAWWASYHGQFDRDFVEFVNAWLESRGH